MRLFLNELSLLGMQSHEELQRTLVDLMEARRRSPNLARVLYCSRRTGDTQALHGERLLTSIARMERDKRSAILAWLGKSGPFLDDGREETDEDLYHLFGSEVTDLGPGEAARQRQRSNDGRLLSFAHRREIDFSVPFLNVVHGFPDEPLSEIKVPNIVSLADAKNAADGADPEPGSWPELLDISRRRFGRLLIGTHCDEVLLPPGPFSSDYAVPRASSWSKLTALV